MFDAIHTIKKGKVKGGSKMKNVFRLLLFAMGLCIFLVPAFCFGAEQIVLSDDFSGNLSTNWITGTNTALNPGGPTLSIISGMATATQAYDYIETKASYAGSTIRVEVDLERISGSNQCLDFVIEFTAARDAAGIVRLRYGLTAKDSINVGIAPSLTEPYGSTTWSCINDDGYLYELDSTVLPYKGTAVLTYNNGNITFAFTNEENQTITTPAIPAGTFDATKIRLWAMGSSGSPRYLDNVKIYTGGGGQAGCNCPDTDNDGVPDDWDNCPATPAGSFVDSTGCPGGGTGIYTQEDMDLMVNQMLEWDTNDDGKIGLIEAIRALQTSAGIDSH